MPYPKPGELRGAYIRRAIKQIRQEEPGKSMKAVLGQVYGMWEEYHGKQSKKTKS